MFDSSKKDVIKFFIAKTFIGIIGLISISLYSSCLDPGEYGDYSLIIGLINVLIAIFIGWIGSSSLRYYDNYKNEEVSFFSNVVIGSFIMIIISIIILYISSKFFKNIPIEQYFVFSIVLFLILSYVDIYEKIFRASGKTNIYVFAILLQACTNISLFYTLVKVYNLGIYALMISSVVSNSLFLIIASSALKISKKIKINKLNVELQKKFLSYGIPMIGVWGISWILNYCDRYIIALFYNSYSVGIYDMSYKLAESSINILITSFTLAIFPRLITTWNESGKNEAEKKVEEVLKYYFFITIPAILGLIFISDKLYGTILDPMYKSGKNILIIVSIGMLFNGLCNILNKIWQLNEKTKNIFYIMIVSSIVNVVLNLMLLPIYGIDIAALATLISYLIANIITYLLVRKEFKIIINYKSLIITILSCIPMCIFLFINSKNVNTLIGLLIEILIAIMIYFIFNIILGNFKSELSMIKNRREQYELQQ